MERYTIGCVDMLKAAKYTQRQSERETKSNNNKRTTKCEIPNLLSKHQENMPNMSCHLNHAKWNKKVIFRFYQYCNSSNQDVIQGPPWKST